MSAGEVVVVVVATGMGVAETTADEIAVCLAEIADGATVLSGFGGNVVRDAADWSDEASWRADPYQYPIGPNTIADNRIETIMAEILECLMWGTSSSASKFFSLFISLLCKFKSLRNLI